MSTTKKKFLDNKSKQASDPKGSAPRAWGVNPNMDPMSSEKITEMRKLTAALRDDNFKGDSILVPMYEEEFKKAQFDLGSETMHLKYLIDSESAFRSEAEQKQIKARLLKQLELFRDKYKSNY